MDPGARLPRVGSYLHHWWLCNLGHINLLVLKFLHRQTEDNKSKHLPLSCGGAVHTGEVPKGVIRVSSVIQGEATKADACQVSIFSCFYQMHGSARTRERALSVDLSSRSRRTRPAACQKHTCGCNMPPSPRRIQVPGSHSLPRAQGWH